MRIFVPSAATLLTDHRAHGEGLVAWRLLRELAARGHELVVWARVVDLHVEPPFELAERGFGARLESLETLAYARAAERFAARGRFDLVHWIFPTRADEAIFLPPPRTPFVFGPRPAPWPAGTPSRERRAGDLLRGALLPLLRARHQRSLAAASAILLETPDAVETLPASARARAHVLAPGVDADHFTAAPPPNAQRILFVGHLESAKGVGDLLEAFARVHAELPASELVFAGEGSERERLEDTARRRGLDGAVQLLHSVAHERVPELLREASLLCLPSHGEPTGNVILEAMAVGRAVVATNAGGPRRFIDAKGGRLVPVGDHAALAAALIELLRDSALTAAMGRHNRERVERELSLARAVDRLESVYREVA